MSGLFEDPLANLTPEERAHQLSVYGIGIAVSPDSWRRQSEELWLAAEVLQQYFETEQGKIERAVASSGATIVDSRLGHQSQIASMLRAMSIECIIKAAWYSLEVQAKGHVARADDPPGHHNLISLLERMGSPIDAETRSLLQWEPYQQQIGRYPFGWIGDGRDKRMQISSFASPGMQFELRAKLLELLFEQTGDPALAPGAYGNVSG